MALDDAKNQLQNDYEDYAIEEAYDKVFFACIKESSEDSESDNEDMFGNSLRYEDYKQKVIK